MRHPYSGAPIHGGKNGPSAGMSLMALPAVPDNAHTGFQNQRVTDHARRLAVQGPWVEIHQALVSIARNRTLKSSQPVQIISECGQRVPGESLLRCQNIVSSSLSHHELDLADGPGPFAALGGMLSRQSGLAMRGTGDW